MNFSRQSVAMASAMLAPGRIVVEGDPGERRFEQVHVRVRALRQSAAAILEKAAEWMGVELRERPAQRHCLPAPAAGLPEGAVPARIGEQREGLIVEVEIRFDRPLRQDRPRTRRWRPR